MVKVFCRAALGFARVRQKFVCLLSVVVVCGQSLNEQAQT